MKPKCWYRCPFSRRSQRYTRLTRSWGSWKILSKEQTLRRYAKEDNIDSSVLGKRVPGAGQKCWYRCPFTRRSQRYTLLTRFKNREAWCPSLRRSKRWPKRIIYSKGPSGHSHRGWLTSLTRYGDSRDSELVLLVTAITKVKVNRVFHSETEFKWLSAVKW